MWLSRHWIKDIHVDSPATSSQGHEEKNPQKKVSCTQYLVVDVCRYSSNLDRQSLTPPCRNREDHSARSINGHKKFSLREMLQLKSPNPRNGCEKASQSSRIDRKQYPTWEMINLFPYYWFVSRTTGTANNSRGAPEVEKHHSTGIISCPVVPARERDCKSHAWWRRKKGCRYQATTRYRWIGSPKRWSMLSINMYVVSSPFELVSVLIFYCMALKHVDYFRRLIPKGLYVGLYVCM